MVVKLNAAKGKLAFCQLSTGNKKIKTTFTEAVFVFLLFQNSKVRRFAFELKMQDKSTFLLAADSEAEMEEWITTLNKILHSSFEQAMQEKKNGDLNDGMYF